MKIPVRLSLHIEQWQLKKPFRIAGYCYTAREIVVVELDTGKFRGRGEAWYLYYCDETIDSVVKQIESIAPQIEKGINRQELLELLPPGGARNAVDCALWDLEAKQLDKTIWELTGITPKPVTTALTIGLEETPENMALNAKEAADYPILKIKLDDNRPVERVAAIRSARPDVRLAIDANQGWTFQQLVEITPKLVEILI